MRRMSFALTTPQIIDRSKTVTRRVGWAFLKPGDRLAAVTKAMGFKKGEKAPAPLATIEVVSVRREPLNALLDFRGYADSEVASEGFGPSHPTIRTVHEFIAFFAKTHRCKTSAKVTRIEFRYVDEEARS